MPQDIVAQFDRKFNAPIEVNRQVGTVTERNNIPSNVRWEGMLVYVTTDQDTYILKGGIGDGDWELFGGLSDAPSDGNLYGRKDGAWDIIPSSGGTISMLASSGSDNANLAGVNSNLLVTTLPANSLAVGDVILVDCDIQLLGNTGTQVNYIIGAITNGVSNPVSGNHRFRASGVVISIGATANIRFVVELYSTNGNFINTTVYASTVDTTTALVFGFNGGGTLAGEVTFKAGWINKQSL